MKLHNERIDIKVNGKRVKSIRNRILNNFLNAMLYNQLDQTNADFLFPNFDSASNIDVNHLYLVYDTPITVNDTDTTMTYNQKVERDLIGNSPHQITTSSNGSTSLTKFTFQVPSTNQIVGLGFGEDDALITDWLLAYVDITALNLFGRDTVDIEVIRFDISSSLMTADELLHHFANDSFYRMTKIELEYNGSVIDSKLVSELTFSLANPGDVLIQGFDNVTVWTGENEYPGLDEYPGTDEYPAQGYVNFDRVRIYYENVSNEYSGYIDLKDLTFDTSTGVVTINLTMERGA